MNLPVEPTASIASPSLPTFEPKDDEAVPAFGIEELFNDFQKPKVVSTDPIKETQDEDQLVINPSSVLKRENPDKVTDLGNGLIEPEVIDEVKFDLASVEPAPEMTQDTFRVIESSSDDTQTHAHSQTLFSNFINNDHQVGLVTATGGTLIANGVTTVRSTEVIGTYLGNGQYAQIVATTAKVFEEDIR